MELVATSGPEGSRDTVWHAAQVDPNRDQWTGWQPFGRVGGGTSAPAAWQRHREGRLEVAIIGWDGSVWRRWQTGPNRWSDWSSLKAPSGDGPMRSLALRQNEDGRLEVFVTRKDGSVWHRWQLTVGSEADWSGWHQFGLPNGDVLGSLAVGGESDACLEVFAAAAAVTGGEQAMWHRWQTAPNGSWSDWTSLGAPGGGRAPGEPVLGQNADLRLELFTVASDNAVWQRWQQQAGKPESWGAPWQALGHQTGGFTEAAVRLDARGRLTLVARSQNRRDLSLRAQVTPGGRWGSWSPLATVPTGPVESPSLHIKHNGGLELFLRTPSTGGLYQLSQTEPDGSWTAGRQWSPP